MTSSVGPTKAAAWALLAAAVGCGSSVVVRHSTRGLQGVCVGEERMLLGTYQQAQNASGSCWHICCANNAQTGNWRDQNNGLCKHPLYGAQLAPSVRYLMRAVGMVSQTSNMEVRSSFSHEGLGW